jgi:threonine dehydrogenase-like Zn-dependent dehydrogenase
MKAVAVDSTRKVVELIEHEPPRISSPTDVVLRILEVGVCGTDREICSFEYGMPPQRSGHLIIGHESLGEVVEIGRRVTRVRVGDLVVPMVRRPCAHDTCPACRAGRQDFCYTGDFTERGINGQHGFMTQQIADDERYMNVVPPELRDVAVLVEPLTIAEKAIEQIEQVQARLPWVSPPATRDEFGNRHNAVVLGAGPVGILGAMAFRERGFEVYVYSREPASDPKAAIAEAIGGTYVSSMSRSFEELAQDIGQIDLVYEATGVSAVAFEMIKVLGPNAVFVFTGVPGRKPPNSIDTDLLMRNLVLKNQVVLGTVNAGRSAFESAIRDLGVFVQRWPDAVRLVISGRYPVEQYRDVLLGGVTGTKSVIRFD